ncbi:MAG: LysR family transcriptional regulator [Halofilum sp. (in: g-proteobacteria)]|nr:LysR family transcriptional regulator [Halofilum sp. (in: g-proteobacteria)]
MTAARLDVRHLAMLRAIADHGSVTHAADRLGVTQSALTHRLREAERRLGADLFARSGRHLRMTPAGERLYATAVAVLDDLERAETDVRTLVEQQRTVVRLGQGTYSRFHWYSDFVRTLSDPDLELDVIARAAREPLTCLLEGAADVVTVHGLEQDRQRLRWLRLASDPLVAIMAPNHALAEKPWLEASDFANERYITYSAQPVPGFEWQRLFRSERVRPGRVSVVGVPEAIIDVVRAGFGVSILSQWAVQPEIDDGTLVARPIGRDGLDLDWWAVVRADEEPDSPASRVAQGLLEYSRMRREGSAHIGFETAAEQ